MSPWNLKHAAVRVLDAGATASLPLTLGPGCFRWPDWPQPGGGAGSWAENGPRMVTDRRGWARISHNPNAKTPRKNRSWRLRVLAVRQGLLRTIRNSMLERQIPT